MPLPTPAEVAPALRTLAERWATSTLGERQAFQSWFRDFCDALGVDQPAPHEQGTYCFEQPVKVITADGTPALQVDPVFEQARSAPKRVIFSAGEDDRVLRAVQIVLDEGIARPILIGRPEIMRRRAERLGLRFQPGIDVELIDPSDDPRYDRSGAPTTS